MTRRQPYGPFLDVAPQHVEQDGDLVGIVDHGGSRQEDDAAVLGFHEPFVDEVRWRGPTAFRQPQLVDDDTDKLVDFVDEYHTVMKGVDFTAVG